MNKVTISLTRYGESNNLVKPCLEALSRQIKVYAEVDFLDQKEDIEMRNLCNTLSNKNIKINYINIPAKSLSFARNKGVEIANNDIILFIDSDAIASNDWAFELNKTFKIKKDIAVVGGKSVPRWLRKPKWYNKSNIAQEVYSLIDLSKDIISTKKIVGVNFGIKRSLIGKEASFNENLGRRPGSLLGGEETDFCRRILGKKLKIYYTPYAIVEHQIQKDRMSLYWLLRRFYYGGLGKALMGGTPKTFAKNRNFYDKLILPIIFIPYSLGYIKGRLSYD